MSGAAAGAAIAVAVAQAIRASGAIVTIEPQEFTKLLNRAERPLIVVAEGGLFKKKYLYLAGYKGLAFYAESPTPLQFGSGAELVAAGKIWIPG